MVYKDVFINGSDTGFSGDRRSAPRFSYVTNLQFLTRTGTVPGIVRNVSTEGLFVEVEAPYSIGKRLNLNFILRSSKYPMNMTGEVVRKTAGGIGLKFV